MSNHDGDFGHNFDYIHARNLQCSIYDPEKLVRQAYENLNHGGWLEIQEAGSLCIDTIHWEEGLGKASRGVSPYVA